MHFTREPVIETVITPKEGCKLVVRSSKNGREDYFVDAVEVVSFGNSFFFRSLERPKSFLLPVSDYEVIELRETRMVLKNVSSEKSIKISPKKEETGDDEKLQERSEERKKRRYRSKKRNTASKRKEDPREKPKSDEPTPENVTEAPKDTSFLKKLIPPPPILIKEKLSREKFIEEPSIEPKQEEPAQKEFPDSKEETNVLKQNSEKELSPTETTS